MKRFFYFFFQGALLAVPCVAAAQNNSADSINETAFSRQLEEVVVSVLRASAKTPMSYSNIGRQEIAERNFGQDIPYLASLTPSAVYTSDAGTAIGYTGLRIRGSDATRTNVTVNGIPLNDAESHSVFWVNTPDIASSLQNMQIQRGAGVSTNGAGAFGASLNLQTETLRSRSYGEYDFSAGAFGTLKHTLKLGTGLLGEKITADLRMSSIESNGYIDRASAQMRSYYIAAGYYGSRQVIKFITFSGEEKTYQAWSGTPSSLLETQPTYNPCGMYKDSIGEWRYYDNQTDNYQQQHYQLIYSRQLNDMLYVHTALHYTKGGGYYEEYKDDASLARYLAPPHADANGNAVKKADVIRQKWLSNDFYGLTFSVNASHKRLQASLGGAANYYDGRHFGKVLWLETLSVLPYEFYRGTGKKTDCNIFAKLNFELLPPLNIYADMQVRYVDYAIGGKDDNQRPLDIKRSYPFFNPKIGALYAFNDRHSLFVSAAAAHREPTRNNFTEAGSNETPTYETMLDGEAGYAFGSKRLSLSCNAYFMGYRNQLIVNGKLSEIGEPLTSNIPHSFRTGVELSASLKITEWLQWKANLALSQNKILRFTEYVDDWDTDGEQRSEYLGTRDIALSPNVVGNSLISFTRGGFSAALHSVWVGRQFIDNTSSADRSIDAYFVNNLQAGYSFTISRVRLAANLQCLNLFNVRYAANAWVYSYWYNGVRGKEDGYFMQAGRHFMFKVTLEL